MPQGPKRRRGKVLLAAVGGAVSTSLAACSPDIVPGVPALTEDAEPTDSGDEDAGTILIDAGILIFDVGIQDVGPPPDTGTATIAVDAGLFSPDAFGVTDAGISDSGQGD